MKDKKNFIEVEVLSELPPVPKPEAIKAYYDELAAGTHLGVEIVEVKEEKDG